MKRLLPSYPIFVKNPYYSLWMNSDLANESNITGWYGTEKPVLGIIFCDGKAYSFLGKGVSDKSIIKLKQTGIEITAFSTIYRFEDSLFDFTAEYFSPSIPDNLDILSCPVCFFSYKFKPKKLLKNVKIALFLNERVCYNVRPVGNKDVVRGDYMDFGRFKAAYMGLCGQKLFSNSTDNNGADWGYFYIAGNNADFISDNELINFIKTGLLISEQSAANEKWIAAFDAYSNISDEICGKMLVAYDDIYSVNYFGNMLKNYYFRNGKTIIDALNYCFDNYEFILTQCGKFGERLKADAQDFGYEYVHILKAALRQTLGAHMLLADNNGRLLYLSMECSSAGCVSTVDVSYPSLPLYIKYNPELIKGMLYPIFDFAKMPVWDYDFAPHDVGVFPCCFGQYYGVKKVRDESGRNAFDFCGVYPEVLPRYYLYPAGSKIYDYSRQMPIEESGNMLIMSAVVLKELYDVVFLREHFGLLNKWASYLEKNGENITEQLCTDDFAGHFAGNINLAIKSNIALAGFAQICNALGSIGLATKYASLSKKRINDILAKYNGKRIPLTFDVDNSYSIKYNVLMDIYLKTGLIPQEIIEKESDYLFAHLNKYGIPLDSRAKYTKSDWLMWLAAQTQDKNKKQQIISCIFKFITESPDRIPFSDWYDTETANCEGVKFKNRSVQGGCFALLLTANEDKNNL